VTDDSRSESRSGSGDSRSRPDPIDLIRAFCRDVEKLDVEVIVGYFTDDVVYHNMPLEPVVGPDAVRSLFAMFTTGVERMEFRVLNIVADGNVVLTERVDVFELPDKTIELPVMGTFEVRDGKIAAWRDYFDLQQYMNQLA
jgi:limonene-1,2-epoxide hydrolase